MRVENWASKLELVIKELKNKDKFIFGKKLDLPFYLEMKIAGYEFNNKYKNIKEAKKIIKSLKSKDLLDIALKIAKENNFKVIGFR